MNRDVYVAEEGKQNNQSGCQDVRHNDATFDVDGVATGDVCNDRRSVCCTMWRLGGEIAGLK